ncbi:MAG: DUF2939 domain-containing protein [Hyphomicrobium sp.]
MRLRTPILGLFFVIAVVAAYVAVPFWTAWSIREAIKSGDSAYLSRKIDFAGVRQTLRPSLAQAAFDIPDPGAAEPAPKPGIWKRIKAYWGKSAIDRFVDSYVTPEGLPKMFQWRKSYREVTGTVESSAQSTPFTARFAKFWSRLKRAEFKSLTAFEIELRDQYDTGRSHVGLLELTGLEWKLTELRVRMASAGPVLESNVSLATDR